MKIFSVVSVVALLVGFTACERHSSEATEHFQTQQLPKSEQEAIHQAQHGTPDATDSHGASTTDKAASGGH